MSVTSLETVLKFYCSIQANLLEVTNVNRFAYCLFFLSQSAQLNRQRLSF